MSEDRAKTYSLLKHNLDILKVDLQRDPKRLTCVQRVENCISLLEMYERQTNRKTNT